MKIEDRCVCASCRKDFSAAIGFCPPYALPVGIGHASSCNSGTIVCMITRNMPFRTWLFTKHFHGEYLHRSKAHGLWRKSPKKGNLPNFSQSQIQTSRSVPNTDLLNTRTEMNLNLHLRQRVYRFEQESSSFNATVVLTQDHCISLDSSKNA